MVIKNIILTFVAMFAVLSIPADKLLVSDPQVEASGAVSREFPVAEMAVGSEQVTVVNAGLPAPVAMPVSVLPGYIPPVAAAKTVTVPVEIVSNIKAAANPEISIMPKFVAKKETIIGVPKLVKMPGDARGFLVSEWLNVPNDVVDRVKTLPVPAFPKPRMKAFSLTAAAPLRLSTEISKRQLLPLLPKALITVPAARPILSTKNVALKESPAIFTRQLLPLLPKPLAAKPAVRSFELTGTTASNISTKITSRQLLPLLPEPAVAKPTFRSFSLIETTSSLSTSSVRTRPLQQLLIEPVIAKPTLRAFALTGTTSPQITTIVAERDLMPLLPVALFRSNMTAETLSSLVSQAPVTRQLMPLLPNSLTRPSLLTETTSSLATSPLEGRRLLPLLELPVIIKQTKPVAGTLDAALTAVNIPPARDPNPVLISGQRALNPLGIIPLPSEMLIAEVETKPASGPSIEASLANEKANTVKPSAAPLPLLITAQNGFSTDMLRPMSARPVFPPNPNSGAPIVTADNSSSSAADGSFCDQNFQGPPIRFSQTVELKLDDLLNQLSQRFGVNFIVGPEISQLPLNVKAGSIPWNVLLRSQLYLSGVRANCINENTIELVRTDKVSALEKARTEAENLETRYYKLKYIQPISSETRNIAGQTSTSTAGGSQSAGSNSSSGGCQQQNSGAGGGGGSGGGGIGGGQSSNLPQRCKFERLMQEIRQILGINDGGGLERIESNGGSTVTLKATDSGRRAYVGQVPGRNMLWIYGTPSQFREIDDLVKRTDVPPWQVVIKGLIYTANEDKIKDVGLRTTITTGTGNPNGGVFGDTLGTLGTLFDFSALIGTVDFNVQASALQRDGVISIKARPFSTVLDGFPADLTVGRQVPVIVQAVNPIGGAAPGSLTILQAANLLNVTPHVIDDDNGVPIAVNLELNLNSNEVDAAVSGQGIPIIAVRSIQSNFNINMDQTAILGGFTVDSDSKTVSKTPGLGDIPLIGELFKRRIRTQQVNRLYFAISVSVLPWKANIETVDVSGATTQPPSITPEMKKRADKAEPRQVVDPK